MAYPRLVTAVKAQSVSPLLRDRGILATEEDGEAHMRRMGIIIISALALSACATAPEGEQSAASGARDCFRTEDVSGYTVIDDNHIGISVGASRQYVLRTMFNANDLDWTRAIALRSSTGRVCTGNGLGVDIIGGDMHRTYPVTEITRAPEEQQPVQGS